MLKTQNEVIVKDGIAVVIGRFQTSELHDGHVELFESVVNRHEKTICILGLSAVKATKNNPLDFTTRSKMIKEKFPNIDVYYNKDLPCDKLWSKRIDEVIETHVPFEAEVTLYGSRDSFIKSYSGKYNTQELLQKTFISSTEVRKKVSFNSNYSKEFSEGVIWATQNQYPTAYCAVDVAIVDHDNKRILLGRKANESKYRMVGGFVDPRSGGESNFLETNGRREVMEETGLVVEQLDYVDSQLIDDWRYRGEQSKIFSTLFIGWYTSGRVEPNDDIIECRWYDLQSDVGVFPLTLDKNLVVKEHHGLLEKVLTKLNIHFLG